MSPGGPSHGARVWCLGRVPKHWNHWQEVPKICTNWEFWGLNNKNSSYCHCPLLLATGSYALAHGPDTKPGQHALVRTDSRRQNLIFFTNRNILHTIKKEPLNIMHLHTGRTMDGPWIKTVPVVSRIFDVSYSTGLEIEGYLTCWKDELGNHTVGTKAQNMHQLRVLGAK